MDTTQNRDKNLKSHHYEEERMKFKQGALHVTFPNGIRKASFLLAFSGQNTISLGRLHLR